MWSTPAWASPPSLLLPLPFSLSDISASCCVQHVSSHLFNTSVPFFFCLTMDHPNTSPCLHLLLLFLPPPSPSILSQSVLPSQSSVCYTFKQTDLLGWSVDVHLLCCLNCAEWRGQYAIRQGGAVWVWEWSREGQCLHTDDTTGYLTSVRDLCSKFLCVRGLLSKGIGIVFPSAFTTTDDIISL